MANARSNALARRGVTLVELLVVLGIISLLLSLLLPALSRARDKARETACAAKLKQIGVAMTAYAQDWRGFVIPPRAGANVGAEDRWPQVLLGPIDELSISCPNYDDLSGEISYLANGRLEELGVRFHSRVLIPSSPAETIAMGEKFDLLPDYYYNLGIDDYRVTVDERRHRREGSNYLYLDMHVRFVKAPVEIPGDLRSPWEVLLP